MTFSPKKLYWITTILLLVYLIAVGGSTHQSSLPWVIEAIQALGTPRRLMQLTGFGQIALVVIIMILPSSRRTRYKERCYAIVGAVFLGALASHLITVGLHPIIVAPLGALGLLIGSYIQWNKSLTK